MGKFGWSYPPGCNGPPDAELPHPKSEEMCELLTEAGCDESVIDAACKIVDDLAGEAEKECPYCLERLVVEVRTESSTQ